MKIYVDQNAARSGNGSREMPFRRINDAAQAARPGDEVHGGARRLPGICESPLRGNRRRRITYRSTTPLGAVITGAEEVKDWKPYQGTVWFCRIDNSIFGNYNPTPPMCTATGTLPDAAGIPEPYISTTG